MWCQEGQNCHIYVKQVGIEPPSQLTNTPMNDLCPAWSPDGRFIAFLRELEPKKRALILIPQRGGSDRQLATWDLSKMANGYKRTVSGLDPRFEMAGVSIHGRESNKICVIFDLGGHRREALAHDPAS